MEYNEVEDVIENVVSKMDEPVGLVWFMVTDPEGKAELGALSKVALVKTDDNYQKLLEISEQEDFICFSGSKIGVKYYEDNKEAFDISARRFISQMLTAKF